MMIQKLGMALGFVAIGGFCAGVYAWSHRLPPITSYGGVRLTDSKADVEYELGIPTDVYLATAQGTHEYQVVRYPNIFFNLLPIIPDGSDWRDGNEWTYRGDFDDMFAPETDVFFANGKILRIECAQPDSDDPTKKNCPTVYGFATSGTTEDEISSKLGEPDVVKTIDGWRLIVYKRLNVSFDLYQMHVFTIYAGQSPPDWDP